MDTNTENNPQTPEQTPAPIVPDSPKSRNGLKQHRHWIWLLLGLVLVVGSYRLGYTAGINGYVFEPTEFKIINKSDQPYDVDYSLLWRALDVVNRKYIDSGQIDQRKVLYGAIRGAVAAAGDEYTEFFDPQTYSDFKTELQGTFSGIGAEIGKRDGNIVIVSPLDNSPAQKAGLLPQDIVLAVDGESIIDFTVDQAARKIRGEKGTQVTLTIFRDGRDSTFDVTITRDTIEVKSVTYEIREVEGRRVGIIELSRFGDDTKRLFDAAVLDIASKNVDGVVLDLRNNPGGYLDTAVDLASDWLDAGKLVVTEAHSEKDTIEYKSDGINRLGAIKTVVLINGGSASASEILAGALRDNGISQLIGEQSFGKGSVQELIDIGNDSAVKVTVAKWITPNGLNLNKEGLKPDIEVEMTEEDYTEQRDPQLDRAIEELLK